MAPGAFNVNTRRMYLSTLAALLIVLDFDRVRRPIPHKCRRQRWLQHFITLGERKVDRVDEPVLHRALHSVRQWKL